MALIKPRGTATPEAELTRYRELIKLDRHALDTAAEEQAQIFLDVCDKHTLAMSVRDEAEETLTRTDATVSSDIRIRSAENKLTEAAIKEKVIQNKDHAKAWSDYEYKRRIANSWGNLRVSFEQRAKMIRELTGQYSAGYFTVQSGVGARRAAAPAGREALHNARMGK